MVNSTNHSMNRKIRRLKKKLRLKYYNEIDIPIGKTLFKNTAGLKFNLQGALSNYKILKISSKNPLALQLAKEGYLDLGLPHSEELIKNISKKFDEQIEDKKYSIIRSHFGGKVYGRMLFNAHKNIPELRDLLNEKIISLLESYYGKFRVFRIFGLRNYHIPEVINQKHELVSSNWHCDQTNTSRVKMMVYLTDVNDDDGPFSAQTLPRTRQLITMGFKSRNNPNISKEDLEDPRFANKFCAPAGTTLFCNTARCLHRATLPKEGHYRDVIHFQFEPYITKLSQDWHNYVLDDSTLYSLDKNNKMD